MTAGLFWWQFANLNISFILVTQLFPNGTLFIAKVYMEDQGRYGCVASNVAGKVRIEAFLTVTSKTPCLMLW